MGPLNFTTFSVPNVQREFGLVKKDFSSSGLMPKIYKVAVFFSVSSMSSSTSSFSIDASMGGMH